MKLLTRSGLSFVLLAVSACGSSTSGPDASSQDASSTDGGLSARADASLDGGHDAGPTVPPDCFSPEGTAGSLDEMGDSAAPMPFWASQPALPDDTVLVTGGAMSSAVSGELMQVPDWPRGGPLDAGGPVPDWMAVPLATATSRSVTFTIPAEWTQGVYAFRMSEGGASGRPILVNRPDPWFVLGDGGATATPGGQITVAGTALDAGGCMDPAAALVADGHVVADLTLAERTASGGYAVTFDVPATTPEGDYELYVHNGRGGTYGWTRFEGYADTAISTVTVRASADWPSTHVVLDTSMGADDDARFATALGMLADGGTLEIPAGTYALTEQLLLPPRTLLVGAGTDMTTLEWTAAPSDPVLIRSASLTHGRPDRGTFALEDLSVVAPNGFTGHGVEREFTSERGWFRRVSITLPSDEANAGVALFLRRAASTEVTDSVLEADISLFAREGVSYLRVTGTTLRWRNSNAYISARSHSMVFSNNTLHQIGDSVSNHWVDMPNPNPGSWFTEFYGDPYFSGPYTRDLLWANNHSSRDATEAQPGYVGQTSDGGTGIYLGGVSSVEGTTLHLAGATNTPTSPSDTPLTFDWAGAVVQILDGTGAGQWRHAVTAGPGVDTIEIDSPFDISPDATSTISVGNYHGHFLFVDNELGNEPLIQQYFLTMDTVVANNAMGMEGAPFSAVAWTGHHYDLTAPSWHFQFLDNDIANATRAYYSSFVGTETTGYDGVVGAAHVYRRAHCAAALDCAFGLRSAHGQFADVVVEHSTMDRVLFTANGEPISLAGVFIRDATGDDGSTAAGLDTLPDGVTLASP